MGAMLRDIFDEQTRQRAQSTGDDIHARVLVHRFGMGAGRQPLPIQCLHPFVSTSQQRSAWPRRDGPQSQRQRLRIKARLDADDLAGNPRFLHPDRAQQRGQTAVGLPFAAVGDNALDKGLGV